MPDGGLSHSYLSPLIDPWPHTGIAQQSHGGGYEGQDNDLVLCGVALETAGQDLVLLLAFAEAVAQAELAIAVIARLFAGSRAQFEVGFGGGRGSVKRNNGAVAEAGAFAEGRGRCSRG